MFQQIEQGAYTVESVTRGHPDKICDQISDAILDALLSIDPYARVAVECFGSHGLLVIAGEVTTTATDIDYVSIARRVYRDIGYTDELEIITRIETQSPDISQGVNTGGAGDQGIMYGFATDETPEYLPRGVVLAHKLAVTLDTYRLNGKIPWLKPDGKTQITLNEGRIETILISTQHDPSISQEEIRNILIEEVIAPIIPIDGVTILTNPTGTFIIGGFEADTGLTGRKIMVDTYGGLAPHGGGCFSGKDATKVDRSGAYMARFVAKNLVAHGYGHKVLVSVSYAIGQAMPLQVQAWNETGQSLNDIVNKYFDFRPEAIIERLQLRTPQYEKSASYGHFGRLGATWEKVLDSLEIL